MLSYHTSFAEYSGETPEEVVRALYTDSKAATGMSRDEWWQYQSKLWAIRYKKEVPEQHTPDAARKLLDILIEVGALEENE